MKYKITDLRANVQKDNTIDEYINFDNRVKDDISAISPIHVYGSYSYNHKRELFKFSLTVEGEIEILSAISLKPVKLSIDFDTDLFYTFKVADDDSFQIYGDAIDLDDEIYGEIMLHLPSKVTLDGEEYDEADNEELEKENPFSILLEED